MMDQLKVSKYEAEYDYLVTDEYNSYGVCLGGERAPHLNTCTCNQKEYTSGWFSCTHVMEAKAYEASLRDDKKAA